jgi:dolichyl-phosphate-mannose-protein mannosyltransferase
MPALSNVAAKTTVDGVPSAQAPTLRKRLHGDQTLSVQSNAVQPNHSSHSVSAKDSLTRPQPAMPKGEQSVWTPLKTAVFWAVVGLALLVRLNGIGQPGEVVFDEVHFGGFSTHYLRREYYFDVHPPLGKMLIAFLGYLWGFDGSFRFEKIGLDYGAGRVPYVFLRSCMALFGTGAIGLALATLMELGCDAWAVGFGGLALALDMALTVQVKFILLDAMLFFFIFGTLYAWTRFRQQRARPFSEAWWAWLGATGAFMAGACGVKLVGLFTVATVGLATVADLWELSARHRGLSDQWLLRHFGARAACLLLLPISLYLSFFYAHFAVLTKTGPGDQFMSPDFQAGLEGNALHSTSRQVFYGQRVHLRSKPEDVFLHSRLDINYPLRHEDGKISSQGQVVDGVSREDADTVWVLLPAPGELPLKPHERRPLRHQSVVRLWHQASQRWLLTHDVASPLTMTNMEVTATSERDKVEGQAEEEKDDKPKNETTWQVEFVQGDAARLMTKSSVFRLQNMQHKVFLTNHQEPLPKWGAPHREVNGCKRGHRDASKWIIADIEDAMEEGERREMLTRRKPRLTFWQKFRELQGLMLRTNGQLQDDHPYKSRPGSWPLVRRGIAFWDKAKQARIYLLGNIVAWYAALAGLLGLVVYTAKGLWMEHRRVECFSRGTLPFYSP